MEMASGHFLLANGAKAHNCKAHAVSYAALGYAAAFLKHHYPLEWWTSVLSNADKNEVTDTFWRHCGHLVDMPDIKLSGAAYEIQGDRIRAPLSLLIGVGEVAHAQLLRYLPYTDIDDFCRKIQEHRKVTGENVTKIKKVKKKVENPDTANRRKKTISIEVDEEDTSFKAGHNALHRGVVYKLIISGVMDSLFPRTKLVLERDNDTIVETAAPRNVSDFLNDYEAAIAEATGKPIKAVPDPLLAIPPLQRYQLRKSIMPAYGEDLLPTLLVTEIPGLKVSEDKGKLILKWSPRGSRAPSTLAFADAIEVERLDALHDGKNTSYVAVAAYVAEAEEFGFTKEGVRKRACKVLLDIQGKQFEYVRWADRDGSLPPQFGASLTGSIVVAILGKWRGDRPFSIEEIMIVEPPYNPQEEEKAA